MKRIAILAVPPVMELDVVGPASVFASANDVLDERHSTAPRYAVEVLSGAASRRIAGQCGISLFAGRPFERQRGPLDTLLVAGGEGARERAGAALHAWLRRRAKTVRRLGAVCTGAYLLAQAGLLEGRRATTHWAHASDLAKKHAGVTVDADPIWVQDGNVYTSAGITAGMDLALALVEEDHGTDVALMVARYLVLFLRRPGGQAQFSVTLEAQAAERLAFRELSVWIIENLRDDLRVEKLAERAGMSDRNFARMFAREVGMSPGRFVERARLEGARRSLESTDAGIDEIAGRCGYRSREVLRRAFLRHVGIAPSEYRERFRGRAGRATTAS